MDLSTCSDWQILISNSVTSSDLRTLRIQSNRDLTTRLNLLRLAGIVNDRLVVAVFAVGEVHSDDVEAILSELVDRLNRVRLGTNCADDRGTTIVLGRPVFRIEGSKPSDLGGANWRRSAVVAVLKEE